MRKARSLTRYRRASLDRRSASRMMALLTAWGFIPISWPSSRNVIPLRGFFRISSASSRWRWTGTKHAPLAATVPVTWDVPLIAIRPRPGGWPGLLTAANESGLGLVAKFSSQVLLFRLSGGRMLASGLAAILGHGWRRRRFCRVLAALSASVLGRRRRRFVFTAFGASVLSHGWRRFSLMLAAFGASVLGRRRYLRMLAAGGVLVFAFRWRLLRAAGCAQRQCRAGKYERRGACQGHGGGRLHAFYLLFHGCFAWSVR